MKRINKLDINDVTYWDAHIAEPEFGLRQEKYLELAGKGDKLLELGCGLSPFLDKARDNFKECYGLDFSQETLLKARQKYPKVTYIHGSVLKTDIIPDKSFDVCVAGELLEHLEDPLKLVEEMKRIARKKIVISSAHMEYNDPEHLWEFSKESLLKLGKKYGKAEVEEIKSDWFPGRSYLFLTIDL